MRDLTLMNQSNFTFAKNIIEQHIKYRKEIIYNRPLEQYECVLIYQHIYHAYSLSEAANFLRLRKVTSLKKLVEQRKRYLQMNGYIKQFKLIIFS